MKPPIAGGDEYDRKERLRAADDRIAPAPDEARAQHRRDDQRANGRADAKRTRAASSACAR